MSKKSEVLWSVFRLNELPTPQGMKYWVGRMLIFMRVLLLYKVAGNLNKKHVTNHGGANHISTLTLKRPFKVAFEAHWDHYRVSST